MDENRKILIFENSHTLTNHMVKTFTQLAEESITQRGRFNVALSGGRTPFEFYSKLSGMEDFELWKNTHIFQADERFVPADDKDSNFRLLKLNFFDYTNIPSENIHPVSTDTENVILAAEQYKNELVQFFDLSKNNLPCFDLILLGIGEDGHTASLFPGEEGLDDPGRVIIPVRVDHLKHDRISLSLSVINNAANVMFQVLGTCKASILLDIFENKKDCPATGVNPTEGQLIFLLDKDSAGKLSYQDSYTHIDEAISI